MCVNDIIIIPIVLIDIPIMLITIVHTVNYGKVVLHKYPYEKVQL